ncbi:XkdX family protein [Pseudoflavonifractor phocaeensis]
MSVYEMAKKYYPRLWPLERLGKLLELGRITQEEYDEIVGEGGDE